MKKSNYIRAKEWFKIGSDEMKAAEVILKDKENKLYSQICFYCQQSTEKYLKGFLAMSGGKSEKIHDLEKLCRQCAIFDNEFNEFIDGCRTLNQYYIPTRYPMHYEIYKKERANDACKIAKEIIGYIRKKTEAEGL